MKSEIFVRASAALDAEVKENDMLAVEERGIEELLNDTTARDNRGGVPNCSGESNEEDKKEVQ